VKRIIAVASGKGGVGKSTMTLCLAYALQARGERVGILDADIYGPSMPRMLGVTGEPNIEQGQFIPHVAHGVQVMSMGFLSGEGTAVIWRASMVTKALKQMLRMTQWEELDTLLVDMPPGTGDVTISLAQGVPLDGVVIVTTPQKVAGIDAEKCLLAFQKLNVPVLGIIENMSGLQQDGQRIPVFAGNAGEVLATQYQVPLLGRMPIQPALCVACDAGEVPDASLLAPMMGVVESL
jgi:ATP-binding protein involved in chromosome partitioning